jgi:hypothetical protein
MKHTIIALLFIIFNFIPNLNAQDKPSQLEISGGLYNQTTPESFGDFNEYTMNTRFNYTFFPEDRLGISFGLAYEKFNINNGNFVKYCWADEYHVIFEQIVSNNLNPSVSGGMKNIEISLGFRPYLTGNTTDFQAYLFGSLTVNILKSDIKHVYGDSNFNYTLNSAKPGLILGSGIEFSTCKYFDIFVQGLYRIIPTIPARNVRYVLPREYGEFAERDENNNIAIKNKDFSFFGIMLGIVF